MNDILNPEDCDVLSGRGVSTNRHPGNIRFRSLVALNKVRSHVFLDKFLLNIPGSDFWLYAPRPKIWLTRNLRDE